MIISIYGIAIFMLTLWIGTIENPKRKMDSKTRLGFSYPAIPSRHAITCKPVEGA